MARRCSGIYFRLLSVLAGIVLLTSCVSASSSSSSSAQDPQPTQVKNQETTCNTISYISSKAPVRAFFCQPPGTTSHLPAVIYLHGSGGPTEILTPGGTPDAEQNPMPDNLPRQLADEGIVTLGIAYFSQTPAPGPNPNDFGNAAEQDYLKALPTWLQTVADGMAFLQQQPRVAHDHIGIIGWSLGAHLALRSATDSTLPYRVVVSISGFVSGHGLTKKDFQSHATTYPPTLILHGDADNVVPVANAYEIRDALKNTGRIYDLAIIPGGDHYWHGQQGSEGYSRLFSFLHTYLI